MIWYASLPNFAEVFSDWWIHKRLACFLKILAPIYGPGPYGSGQYGPLPLIILKTILS